MIIDFVILAILNNIYAPTWIKVIVILDIVIRVIHTIVSFMAAKEKQKLKNERQELYDVLQEILEDLKKENAE